MIVCVHLTHGPDGDGLAIIPAAAVDGWLLRGGLLCVRHGQSTSTVIEFTEAGPEAMAFNDLGEAWITIESFYQSGFDMPGELLVGEAVEFARVET